MIRILVADKVRLISEVISTALASEPDVQVVGIASSVDSVLGQLEDTKCDLCVFSLVSEEGDWLPLIQDVRERYPNLKIVVMGLVDVQTIILRYIEAGADGYVLREDGIEDLLHNVRAVVEDKALVSPVVASRLMARLAELSQRLEQAGVDFGDAEELTPRETEIFDLLSDGLSNQEIASKLHIQVGTVKNHVHSILDKLNISSRKDAALYAALLDEGADE